MGEQVSEEIQCVYVCECVEREKREGAETEVNVKRI